MQKETNLALHIADSVDLHGAIVKEPEAERQALLAAPCAVFVNVNFFKKCLFRRVIDKY